MIFITITIIDFIKKKTQIRTLKLIKFSCLSFFCHHHYVLKIQLYHFDVIIVSYCYISREKKKKKVLPLGIMIALFS